MPVYYDRSGKVTDKPQFYQTARGRVKPTEARLRSDYKAQGSVGKFFSPTPAKTTSVSQLKPDQTGTSEAVNKLLQQVLERQMQQPTFAQNLGQAAQAAPTEGVFANTLKAGLAGYGVAGPPGAAVAAGLTLAPTVGGYLRRKLFGLNEEELAAQQQQEYQQSLQQQQQELLGRLGEPVQGIDISGLEDQARREQREQIIPEIAERFTGVGGQSSSAFTQALGEAGVGLEERLHGLRAQEQARQQEVQEKRMGLMGSLLGGAGQLGLGQAQLGLAREELGVRSAQERARLGLQGEELGVRSRLGEQANVFGMMGTALSPREQIYYQQAGPSQAAQFGIPIAQAGAQQASKYASKFAFGV